MIKQKNLNINLMIVLCLLIIAYSNNVFGDKKKIKVGVYENRPLVFTDHGRERKGFYIDVLKHIAKDEHWKIKYESGTLRQGLEKLKQGKIDLMLAVSQLDEYKQQFDFNKDSMLTNWGQLYKNKDSSISTIIDLKNKTIVGLRNDPYFNKFKGIVKSFHIPCNYIEVDGNYKDVFKKISKKKADAGIVSRLFGNLNEQDYDVASTTIIFHPLELKFAVKKGQNEDIIEEIDDELRDLKKHKESIYYQSLNQWLMLSKKDILPKGAMFVFFSICGGFVIFIIGNIILRKQVKRKTRELLNEIDERKKAERDLKESEEKYRTLIENINIGVYKTTTNSPGYFLHANSFTVKLFGYDSLEELMQVSVEEMYQDPACKNKLITKVLEQRAIKDHEIRMKKKDGSCLCASVSVSAHYDDDGNIKCLDGVIEDISIRKKAEKALKESEERYRILVELSPDGIIMHIDNKIIFANQSMLTLLGADSVDQLLGKDILDFIHPDYKNIARERINSMRKNRGEVPTIEEKLVKFDQTPIDVDVSASNISYKNTRAIQVVIRDISKRKVAERALKDSEERYRNLVELSPDGIMLHCDSEIVFVNQAVVKLLGAESCKQIIGKNPLDFVHPDYVETVRTKMNQLIEGAFTTTSYDEFKVNRLDGQVVTMEESASIINFQRKPAIQSIFRDITERKQFEKELLRYREHLEDLVEERTQQLIEEQENYRNLVETMNEGLGTFNDKDEFIFANKRLCEMLGYNIDELIGRTAVDFFNLPDDYEGIYQLYQDYENKISQIKAGQKRHFEMELKRKDGTNMYTMISPRLFFDGNDDYKGGIWVFTDITDRRIAEEELKSQEEKYRSLIETMNEGLGAINARGKLTFANKRLLEMTGYSLDEIIGHTPDYFYSINKTNVNFPEKLRQIRALTSQNQKPQAYHFETEMTKKNGEKIHVMVSPKALYDNDGQFTGGISVISDITERKKIEEELKRQEEKYRLLVERMNEGLYMLDEKGIITYANNKVYELLGYSEDEVIGSYAGDNVADEQNRQKMREQMALRQEGRDDPYELEFVRKDGKRVSAIVSPKPILDGNGKYTGSFGVLTDITERKKMEIKLRESEEFFRLITENASDIISKHSHVDGVYLYVSPSCINIMGYQPEELLGRSVFELYHSEDLEKLRQGMEEAFERMSINTISYRMLRKNGSYIWMETTIRFINNPLTDEVEGMIASSRDITERKNAEEALQEKNDQLEKTLEQVKEMQDKIVMQEKMASLGSLTAGIAHEIKNPLNFVNNFARFSLDLTNELRELIVPRQENIGVQVINDFNDTITSLEQYVTKINEHGQRANSIVRGMLLHSRGKPGEYQLTDINSLLDEYVNLAYHGMRANDVNFNIAIYKDFDPDIGDIEVIPQDLSRAFLNILNNGCYAAYEKKKQLGQDFLPSLHVKTANLTGQIEIRIRDNGNGIAQDIKDKVFMPFFTTKPAGTGTGLGLSITYDIIVQSHKGDIRVDTKEGEFSEFIILLPKNY